MNDVSAIEQRFNESPFFQHIGCHLFTGENGEMEIHLPITPELINANGSLHGGVYATVIDNAMSVALRRTVPADIITVTMNVHFLAAIKDGTCIGKGKVIQQGYKLAVCEAVMEDQNGTLLATGSGTFKILRKGSGHENDRHNRRWNDGERDQL
ncbi:PaaI family thioesterase [Sinobaca sp. H24]|uniref:PaaI family thioesterase n=1 Tax=Sinobaca sp. H24 TaxID=2923376 RepID=UPI002079FEB1|nr:PaaI family thioesterase [Sinobaca sp. H24]